MRGAAILIVVVSLAKPALANDDIEIAKQRYQTGKVLFERARFAEALVEFEAARDVLGKPEFDYNIGQCLARLGRPADAADALERYMRVRPDDPDAALIWEQVARLRREAARLPRTSPPAAEPAPAPAAPPGEPRAAPLGSPRRRAALAVGLVGGALLLSAAVTGGLALDNRDRYDAGCMTRCDDGLYDQGRRLAIATDVLIGVGAAAVVTAIILAVVPRRERLKAASGGLVWVF